MEVKVGGRSLSVDAVSVGAFGKFRGLMFRRRQKAPMLLFETGERFSIHSVFVFFDFLVLWLNDENTVVDYKIVKPFSLYENSDKKFSKILEIPVSKQYYDKVKFVVGERFKNKRVL